MGRTVFFISDRTGITAETLGHSLITQFDEMSFTQVTLPFIDTEEKAAESVDKINQAFETEGVRPIVFSTVIDDAIRTQLEASRGFFMDFVHTFIGPLEKELGVKSNHTVGRTHGVGNIHAYDMRIEAVNYALRHDDGASFQQYEKADLILLGVSRSGKTPTSLYLAMQFGLMVANYPITEEDMRLSGLPTPLLSYRTKLFGLTIAPKQLQHIRSIRRPNSHYSDLEQCRREVQFVEALYTQEKIPYLSSTNRSIEELATKIINVMSIERQLR
jgi:regulator of PEP synthase PpsR (kinase-PPPase family)